LEENVKFLFHPGGQSLIVQDVPGLLDKSSYQATVERRASQGEKDVGKFARGSDGTEASL